jgi:transposase
VKAAHPADEVEVWGQGEARLGLKPVLRRVRAPRGNRPRALTDPRYEWLWVYAAAHPLSGRVFWLILPRLSAEMAQLFLDEFARSHAPAGKRVVLAWDGAPAHRAGELRVPERITIVPLPAYTPELNPAERLWPLVKEGMANRAHETLAALEHEVCGRCQRITAAQVAALTNYHRWPTA